MRANWLPVVAGVLLAGCTRPGAEPVVKLEPVIVDRPVPCVAGADIPLLPEPVGSLPPAANAALSVALAKLLEFEAYAKGAQTIMETCSRAR